MSMQVTYVPRGKFVLLREVRNKVVRGIVMPDQTTTGNKFVVEAVGSKVTDLKPGDEVVMMPNCPATRLDEATDLYLIQKGFIISTVVRTSTE